MRVLTAATASSSAPVRKTQCLPAFVSFVHGICFLLLQARRRRLCCPCWFLLLLRCTFSTPSTANFAFFSLRADGTRPVPGAGVVERRRKRHTRVFSGAQSLSWHCTAGPSSSLFCVVAVFFFLFVICPRVFCLSIRRLQLFLSFVPHGTRTHSSNGKRRTDFVCLFAHFFVILKKNQRKKTGIVLRRGCFFFVHRRRCLHVCVPRSRCLCSGLCLVRRAL